MKRISRTLLFVIALMAMLQCCAIGAQAAGLKKTKITSLKQTYEKEATVKWKKISGASGYNVSYRVSGGKWKSIKTKSNKLTQVSVHDLKENRTYQFRVRAYKTAKDANNKKKTVYGKYSQTNKIKIRRMANTNANEANIYYRAHIQDVGWMPSVVNGQTAGVTGKGLRMEAFEVDLTGVEGGVTYRAHVQNVGWQNWVKNKETAGTTGRALRMEAVQIKLTGAAALVYDVKYRVYVEGSGWQNWVKNGATAGTTGKSLRTAAIQIKLEPKNVDRPSLTYKAHCENAGWMTPVKEGETAGTTGASLRLEALVINLKTSGGKNGISYRAHVQDIGWQSWVTTGGIAGTTNKAKQIEAVEIKLAGGLEQYLDIYYRIHVKDFGWLGWAKNGQTAGTTGGSIRAEAIQIKTVIKGSDFYTGGDCYIDASNLSNGVDFQKMCIATHEVQGRKECVLTSISMLIRHERYLEGKSFGDITKATVRNSYNNGNVDAHWGTIINNANRYSNVKKTMTTEVGRGLSNPRRYLIDLLSTRPEGVVCYFWYNGSNQHAVVFTDYDKSTDTFYVSDPASANYKYVALQNSYLLRSYVWKNNESKLFDNIDRFVYYN